MSESLAGVTLLALGNGSPDVISSLSAANSDSGGMFLAVGSLVGGGMFVSGVVSAIVLLSSPKPVKVAGMGFLRDTLFYIVSLLVLVIAAIVGELSFYFAITFFVIYIIFVISVIIIDRIEMKRREARKEMRATIAQKRSTIGAISNKEQQMLDTADYDEDAYYYKDELDNLVEVEIEVEDYHEEEKGEFSHRFDRMMTEIEESMKIDYEDEEGSTELDNPKNGQNNDLKPPNSGPNMKVQNNDSLLSSNSDNKDKELRYSLLPKIQNMQTQIETQNNLTASQKSRFDAELTDKIDKTKIEPSKNLSSFIVDEHYEEYEPMTESQKANFHRKGNIAKAASHTKHRIVWSMLKMKKFLKKGIEGEQSFSEMNWFNKIIFIFIDAPIDFIRRLTIPPPDHEQWNRRNAAVVPITSTVFVFTILGILDYKSAPPIAFYVCLGIALILSVLICTRTPLNNGPRRFMIVFSIFSFIMSIAWIWFIANILIDLLGVLGLIFGFKPAYLGITLLAWGNSVGDMMANSAVAKKGFARMALIGCFAGPLFNLLMGLGLSLMIKKIGNKPPEKFELQDKEALLPMLTIAI